MGQLGEHAIVIGGSIAGLMAARVLSEHFDRVTVIERDTIEPAPALRRSVPQAAHIHALLLAGEQVMSSLYPGFTQTLRHAGALALRAGRDVAYFRPDGKSYSPGGAMKEPRDLGFDLYGASRPLIEHCVREHTQALANVRFETATVHGLLYRDARVRGVRCEHGAGSREVAADLIVDAGGRGSRALRWLAELGFAPPEETVIGIDMAYASACFAVRDDAAERERQLVFRGPPPAYRRSAILSWIEGGRWHVTLAGRFGDDPPFDPHGFHAFARGLHSPRLHQLIDRAERIGPIAHYHCPTSVWRHYERMPVRPEGWIALGDAIASFNPIYGQGMSVAALHCRALQNVLASRVANAEGLPPLDGVGATFFRLAAAQTEAAWTLAANQDLAFPQTRGARPPGLAERAHYAAMLDAMIPEDPQLHRLLAEVVNLTQPLSALTDEPLRSRVLLRLRAQTPAA